MYKCACGMGCPNKVTKPNTLCSDCKKLGCYKYGVMYPKPKEGA